MLAKYHLIYNLLLILISIERFCHCESLDPHQRVFKSPSELIEHIIKKVCNMTVHTLAASPNVEKDVLISKIEKKLLDSAKALKYDGNYVQLIMKGVKLVAYNNTRKNDDTSYNNEIEEKPKDPTKSELVNNIAKKVELIAKIYSKKSKKSDDRNEVLKGIQKVLEKAASKKHKELHAKHSQMKTYSSLITQGIEQAIEKIKEARRMELQLVKKKKPSNDGLHSDMFAFKRKSEVNKQALDEINPNTARPSSNLKDLKELKCHVMKNHICMDIKSLNVLECPSDNTEISIEKLCDGMMDCSDSSDERNCTGRVLEIVRNASGLMTEIELAIVRNCYPPSIENTVISKENEILREVLRTQVNFIQKHSMDNQNPVSNMRTFPANLDKAKSAANEVVSVIHTLSLALRSALCLDYPLVNKTRKPELIEKITRVNEISEDSNNIPTKTTLSSCVCYTQYCMHSNCREDCKDVCWQNYTLVRWQCDAVVQGKSVSFDEICDGKLDCFDESDENGCFEGSSFAKFEANNMYELIIETILLKIKAERVESIRKLLIKFSSSVRSLQSLTAKRNPDKLEIKGVRDQCFAEMVLIYEEHLKMSTSIVEMHKIYGFLINLHHKLISAIKRSHTGNDRIITADGCYCTNNKCSLPRCSKTCVRACGAEPILTRYYCGNSSSYVDSIPPSAVCNYKIDCPDKDDEQGCQTDVCRKHHLVLLRHNIRSIGDNRELRGTSVGEALNSWKIKVSATLRIAESEERPTPQVMHDIVKAMLRDLLMTYAGMEEGKKSKNDLVLQQFYNVSQIVIESLRSCGK